MRYVDSPGHFNENVSLNFELCCVQSILKDLMEEHNHKPQKGTPRRIQSYRKSALRGEYYPRQRKDRHESVAWECDSRTGCRARTDGVSKERHPIITATNAKGQQIPLSADDEELETNSIDQDENQEDDGEEEKEEDTSLDNYEQLKELYRNCHSSSGGNRYSYLVNCSPYNQQNEHPHSNIPQHNIAPGSQSRYLNALQSAAAHSDGLGDMFHHAPGTVTFSFVALLILAILLVEMVDVFCYRRRRRSRDEEEDRHRRATRRRLRTRAVQIPTVTVYESPFAYESEKTSWTPGSGMPATHQLNYVLYFYLPLIICWYTVYTIIDQRLFPSLFICTITTYILYDTNYFFFLSQAAEHSETFPDRSGRGGFRGYTVHYLYVEIFHFRHPNSSRLPSFVIYLVGPCVSQSILPRSISAIQRP